MTSAGCDEPAVISFFIITRPPPTPRGVVPELKDVVVPRMTAMNKNARVAVLVAEDEDPLVVMKRGAVTNGDVRLFELRMPLDPEARVSGVLQKVSHDEACLTSPQAFKRGAQLNMHFTIADLKDHEASRRDPSRPFHAIGRVVNVLPGDRDDVFFLHVRFTDIFEEDRQFLRDFVISREGAA